MEEEEGLGGGLPAPDLRRVHSSVTRSTLLALAVERRAFHAIAILRLPTPRNPRRSRRQQPPDKSRFDAT